MKKISRMRSSNHKIEKISQAEHQKAEHKEILEDLRTDKRKSGRPQVEREINNNHKHHPGVQFKRLGQPVTSNLFTLASAKPLIAHIKRQ